MMKDIKINSPGLKGSVKLDLTKLEAIEVQLRKRFAVKIGILGASSHNRKVTLNKIVKGKGFTMRAKGKASAGITNASIGLIHEKGSVSKGIPARSFLYMPLSLKLPGAISKVGPGVMKSLTANNIKIAYAGLGVLAENIVQTGFATHGYGKWAPNAPSTVRQKKSSRPLIDTAQLRRSVTSTVVTK